MVPFVVEHHLKARSQSFKTLDLVAPLSGEATALVFETCMRKIVIQPWGEHMAAGDGIELLKGTDAYCFLLGVLSGLKSPVFGETEVFSQFKSFWEKAQEDHPRSAFFAPWAKCLFEDVKKIRSEFFRDSTTQTWGGVVRKNLRPFSSVWILGNGELAMSVAASLKGSDVVLWARREKPELKYAHFPLSETPTPIPQPTPNRRALVVCAPLSNEDMQKLAAFKPSHFDYVMDLRELQADRLSFIDFDLKDIDSVSEIHHHRQQEIIHKAEARIVALADQTWDLLWHRPSGWEDLCG